MAPRIEASAPSSDRQAAVRVDGRAKQWIIGASVPLMYMLFGVTWMGFVPLMPEMLAQTGAKVGLLDYIIGVARDPAVAARSYVVPVAINYDRVLEDRSLLREMLRFGVPLMPAGAAMWAGTLINRPVVLAVGSPAMLGVLGAGFRIGTGVLLLVNAFQLAWPAFAYSIKSDEEARRIEGDARKRAASRAVLASPNDTRMAPAALPPRSCAFTSSQRTFTWLAVSSDGSPSSRLKTCG